MKRRRLPAGLALACTGALALGGCPDTTLPPFDGSGRARVCTADELLAFQTAGFVEERDDLWIAFVDVGHGDATWIRTPGIPGVDAQEILVDAGNCRVMDGDCGLPPGTVNDASTPDGVGALIDFMSGSGLPPGQRIDLLVATHPDKDHYGGVWRVLDEYDVAAFLDPGIAAVDQSTYQLALDKVGQEQGVVVLRPAQDAGIDPSRPGSGARRATWGRGLAATLLASDKDARDDNNGSIVLRLDYLGVRILLAADAEAPLDAQLAALGSDAQAQVLRSGHHGGVDTSTQTLLDAVFPAAVTGLRYAIVSAGERDGLPRDDTLDRLLGAVGAARLYRTDRDDAGKSQVDAPGDDHVLLRVTGEGELTVCYAFPDRG
ncbi:MAG: MBL fold metallo-hydrolase [Myxococcales bacterium]|nr:MBL fold metallo-hydrolase [Myxococcales bacterium]